jgi:uncharacterized protein (TIGR02594 family)
MDPFQIAAKQLGMNENDQNAALTEYLSNGGVNLDPAVTAWCAAYVNATLQQAGMEGTDSNLARSFLDWGQEVKDPRKGDVVVFSRGDPNGPYGHVGFFDGYNEDGTIRVLGGNQGAAGEVSIANYGTDRLLGFRRAAGAPVDMAVDASTGPAGAPQNALAPQPVPEPPRPQIAMADPSTFMVARSNALASFQPITPQRVNYLSGRA